MNGIKAISAFLFGSVLASCGVFQSKQVPVRWEHGWKTERVTATRYKSDMMGLNIGFTFPKNQYDCDRAEISDFMEAYKGSVFQGGGYPGAEMYVVFDDVKTKEDADKKLQEILPGLDGLMASFSGPKGDTEKLMAKLPKVEKSEWPDTTPPDKTDPYWKFNNNMNVNGTQYMKAEVSPGKWQWVVDEEAEKASADAEAHKNAIWNALMTRVLTDAEFKEAVSYGTYLNVQPNVPYSSDEKSEELTRAFIIQRELRERGAK